ncbi:PrsW family intramembrane metalloprotease [Thermomicrobium sp. CFH 73360]|uniref:PrsW family intramembrane metalloprotease n=1 Tax=Thermomicrobium sp. CFH 73360 TaxID=2951987 RepID=UPI002076A0E5|nr:PrsW family intramembrane metalloprotease [Thermomicrobium sp. CFH 73360]MCM8745668.1 PrsW family intramembrane metalloprotease [Thermomicrobium sp. CFH 73360]
MVSVGTPQVGVPIWNIAVGCLGGLVLLSTCCIVGLLVFGASLEAVLIGGVLAVIVAPLYAMFLLWLDPLEHEPPWLLLIAFFWGAGVGTLAGGFSTLVLDLIARGLFGASGAISDAASAVIFAPVTEELAKGAFLFFLFALARHEFDDVVDGIVYGGLVGLGFAVVEDFAYYLMTLAEEGLVATGALFVIRGLLAGFGHPFYTALTGLGCGLARSTRSLPLRVLAPLGGLAGAMFFHALWNGLAVATAATQSVGLVFLVLVGYPFGILLPGALLLAIVAVVAARGRRRDVQRYLQEAVSEGLATPDDLEALTRPWSRRARQFRMLTTVGWRALWLRRRLDIALVDWAYRQWHRARGDRLPYYLAAFESEALERRIRRWRTELDQLQTARVS